MNTVLSESTPPRRNVFVWFLVGTATAVILLWSQAIAVGGWSGLLQVGEGSNLQTLIREQLPDLAVTPGPGHDGQISYAVGLDLAGKSVPDLLDHAGYRYRRILYPALASVFGAIDGNALLVGMIVLAAIGMGLSSAGLALLSSELGAPKWVQLGVLANPGIWLAVRLLTPDALAMGLALMGLGFAMRSRHSAAIALLTAAALTKDQYFLVAIGMAIFLWNRKETRKALAYLAVPGAALAIWAASLTARIGAGFTPRANFALPFVGIWNSAKIWPDVPIRDLAFAIITLGLVIAAGIGLWQAHSSFLHAIGWLWIALPILSSSWVWDYGNNALRAFAFLMPLATLACGLISTRRSQRWMVTG